MTFDYAAAIAARPSDAELPRALGIFRYRDAYDAEGKKTGGVIPDPAWAASHLVKVDLTQFSGFPPNQGQPSRVLWMHKQVAPVFIACMQEAAGLGLLSRLHEYNGCYVPRHMGWTPGRPLSVHSWGAAIDFDASTNGYRSSHMGIDRDFVRHMEERGFTWGGRWGSGFVDGMHFQWSDPLPGTAVMPWQDAMGKAGSKPVSAQPLTRRVLVNGQPMTGRRTSLGGISVVIDADGGVWLQPDDGTPAPTGPTTGNSPRVTLEDQSGVWTPFLGRAVYRGLMLNLDARTQDLWIRPATDAERGL